MLKDYISLIRPSHYIKNLFIFAPLFFGLQITDINLLSKTFLAFISFSMVASAIYIFNDYHDVDDDREHPTKKNRPLASGSISKRNALALMVVLLSLGLCIAALFFHSGVLIYILAYLCMNVLYTLKLKHMAIIDTFTIAAGFVIRLFVGSSVTDIMLSKWIILMTFLLALFLALAKRRNDILIFLDSGKKTRSSIDGYSVEFLNQALTMNAAVIIVSYIMYSVSPEVAARDHTDKLYLTVIFVIFGLMRYLQLSIVEKKGDSPTDVLINDRSIQLSILGWVVMLFLLIY
jgi:4-hydroxybenzoate polyprenyltransferase